MSWPADSAHQREKGETAVSGGAALPENPAVAAVSGNVGSAKKKKKKIKHSATRRGCVICRFLAGDQQEETKAMRPDAGVCVLVRENEWRAAVR